MGCKGGGRLQDPADLGRQVGGICQRRQPRLEGSECRWETGGKGARYYCPTTDDALLRLTSISRREDIGSGANSGGRMASLQREDSRRDGERREGWSRARFGERPAMASWMWSRQSGSCHEKRPIGVAHSHARAGKWPERLRQQRTRSRAALFENSIQHGEKKGIYLHFPDGDSHLSRTAHSDAKKLTVRIKLVA